MSSPNFWEDHMKENEMGGTSSTHGVEKKYKFPVEDF
jgi:hypothetical protein